MLNRPATHHHQREILTGLGVAADLIYLDKRLTGINRARPGPALAAVRAGDTLVIPKLDRLARSVPDARDIGDTLRVLGRNMALLVLPWVLVWTLAPHHHLDATAVTILVSVTIPLAGLWLAWAAFRKASKSGPADSGAGSGIITAGPGSVVADRGGIAVGPGSVVADREGTAIGQIVY